jgi:hypothetical protein
MASSLPYLPSNKNLEMLFSKIQSAKVPDKFTHSFLQTTIGLKGTNDRPLIPFLRALGFINQSGTPTPTYRLLKSKDTAKAAIAQAILQAYAPLFEADENAHTYSGEKLKGLIAQVAGTDDDMTSRIVSTFNALAKLGDFSAARAGVGQPKEPDVWKWGREWLLTAGVGLTSENKKWSPKFSRQFHFPFYNSAT